MKKLNFKPETTKGKVFTGVLITTLISGGIILNAYTQIGELENRIQQNEACLTKTITAYEDAAYDRNKMTEQISSSCPSIQL